MRAKCMAIAAVAMMITMAGFSQAQVKTIVLNAGAPDANDLVMTMEIIDQDHARLVNKEDPHLTGLLTRMWR
jgi:hypothetical protein